MYWPAATNVNCRGERQDSGSSGQTYSLRKWLDTTPIAIRSGLQDARKGRSPYIQYMMMALVVPLVVAGLVLRTCVWEVCTAGGDTAWT